MVNISCERLDNQWGYIIKSDDRSAIVMYFSGWCFAAGKEKDGDLEILDSTFEINPKKAYTYGEKLVKSIENLLKSGKLFKGSLFGDPPVTFLLDKAGQLLCPDQMNKSAEVITLDESQYIIKHNGRMAVSFYVGKCISALVQIVDSKPTVMCSRPFLWFGRHDQEYRIKMRNRAIAAFTAGKEIEKELHVNAELNSAIENAAMRFLKENYG